MNIQLLTIKSLISHIKLQLKAQYLQLLPPEFHTLPDKIGKIDKEVADYENETIMKAWQALKETLENLPDHSEQHVKFLEPILGDIDALLNEISLILTKRR